MLIAQDPPHVSCLLPLHVRLQLESGIRFFGTLLPQKHSLAASSPAIVQPFLRQKFLHLSMVMSVELRKQRPSFMHVLSPLNTRFELSS